MNAQEFFYLVAQMRQAQNDYFRTRSQLDLRHARALERDVDFEIQRAKAIMAVRPPEPTNNTKSNGDAETNIA